MFTVTNLVDRNLPEGDTQEVDIENLLMTHISDADDEQTVYMLRRVDLIEPQKGRMFIPGNVFIPGMIFKKVMPSVEHGVISEIIAQKNKVVNTVYVVVATGDM